MFKQSHSRLACDGISRRQGLKIGASGLLGGLTLPRFLEMEARASFLPVFSRYQ